MTKSFLNKMTVNGVTFVIVAINICIKKVSVALISQVGYDTHSELATRITNSVFFGQFFNTAIIVVLVYANFTEFTQINDFIDPELRTKIIPKSLFFDGPFYDYQPLWFALVGR